MSVTIVLSEVEARKQIKRVKGKGGVQKAYRLLRRCYWLAKRQGRKRTMVVPNNTLLFIKRNYSHLEHRRRIPRGALRAALELH